MMQDTETSGINKPGTDDVEDQTIIKESPGANLRRKRLAVVVALILLLIIGFGSMVVVRTIRQKQQQQQLPSSTSPNTNKVLVHKTQVVSETSGPHGAENNDFGPDNIHKPLDL